MSHPGTLPHESYPDPHHEPYSRTTLGFWIYLMSDFILFGALFATYAVLRHSTFGGPPAKALFDIDYTLGQTLILLASSFTAGLGGAAAHRNQKRATVLFFSLTFLLGAAFMAMEFAEYARFIQSGNHWDRSGFLSAFFSLIATHGLHVLFGMLWILVLLPPLFWEETISHVSIRRLTCLRMFWQFINIIWVLIFSFVYLMGVIE